jgi:hypothetical protein
MKRLATLIFLVLASSPIFAKCATQTITVSGTVIDTSGQPVAGVAVAVSWVLRGKPEGPAQGQTDSVGKYDVSFEFNYYSKSSVFRGDICREDVSHVSVSAYTPGHRAEPVLIPVVAHTAEANLVLIPASP